MSIGARIKALRGQLELSQAEFASKIGLKQAAIGLYENGQRAVPDTTVILISQTYGANDVWLRTGQGDMLQRNASNVIDQLAQEYEADDVFRAIIDGYLQLGPIQRKTIKDYIKNLASAVSASETESYAMPAHGNSAARGVVSAEDKKTLGKIKNDLLDEDDSGEV